MEWFSTAGIRRKGIVLTGFSFLSSRAILLLSSIISIPLIINNLGKERYGLYATLLSVIVVLGFADLGLGLGLQNRVALLAKSKGQHNLKKAISSTFFFLVLVSFLAGMVLWLAWPYINWSELLNLHSGQAIDEASTAVAILASCFLFSLPFTIVKKLQNGFQTGYFNEIWTGVGNIAGLLLLILLIWNGSGIPLLILATFGATTLFLILNFGFFFRKRKVLMPDLSFLDKEVFLTVLKEGGLFFFLQLLAALTNSIDAIILAGFVDTSTVAEYSTGYRIIVIATTPIIAFLNPMLPAVNDAIASGEEAWIKKTFRKAGKYVFFLSLISFLVILLLGNTILEIWINKDFSLSLGTWISFCFLIFYINYNALFSSVMLSTSYLRKIIIWYPIGTITAIILKITFASTYGIPGVLWATILSMGLLFFLPSLIILRRDDLL